MTALQVLIDGKMLTLEAGGAGRIAARRQIENSNGNVQRGMVTVDEVLR